MTTATVAATRLARKFNTPEPAIRRVGNSFYIKSKTDSSEGEHRIDFLGGRLFCSCIGFCSWRHCYHQERVLRVMTTEERAIVTTTERLEDNTALPEVWRSPQDLARRLSDMVQERGLVQQFFQQVMVPSRDGEADGDYGIIPGTDKPTLFKAGAEKLCELYGYAPTIANLQEVADYETGHYRVICTIALVHKGSGVKVGEGVGECNTRESRYFYRWAFASDVPAGLDRSKLKTKEVTSRKNGNTYTMFKLENDDLFSLWNTILKMAKKRALVDATLSTTRSSGIFSQSKEHLDEYVDAEYSVGGNEPASSTAKPAAPKPAAAPTNAAALGPLRNKLLKVIEELKTWDRDAQVRSLTFLHQMWPAAFDVPTSSKKPDVTKLNEEQLKHVISLLQPDHDHDPAYDSEGNNLHCQACGCPLPETPAAGAQQATFE